MLPPAEQRFFNVDQLPGVTASRPGTTEDPSKTASQDTQQTAGRQTINPVATREAGNIRLREQYAARALGIQPAGTTLASPLTGDRRESGLVPGPGDTQAVLPAAGTNIVINNQSPSCLSRLRHGLFGWCHHRRKDEHRLILGATETTTEEAGVTSLPSAGTTQTTNTTTGLRSDILR
jgi:hypothetical protein